MAQGFLPFLLASSPAVAWVCLFGRSGILPFFCSLCPPLTPPSPVVSDRLDSRCADGPLGWHFLSAARASKWYSAPASQHPRVPGPPAGDEAMGSLVHGEILVWTWMSLTGTSSQSHHPVLVSVQPEQLCSAAAGPA